MVNLDAFETFFPERRPFFVEGSGTFRFNMDCNDGNCTGMFYSRRIGRAPQGSAEVADDEYSKQPAAATIIGAAKLTGRAAGFSIGALTAVTAMEDAEIAGVNSVGYRSQVIEPMTSYTVLRARREFQNQSSLGVMTTGTIRQFDPATSFLSDNAFAAGGLVRMREARKGKVARHPALVRYAEAVQDVDGGDAARGLRTLDELLPSFPLPGLLRVLKGRALFRLGRLDEALAAFDQAPDDPSAWVGSAEVLIAKGDFEKALASAEAALGFGPRHPGAWTAKGVSHAKIGRPRGASLSAWSDIRSMTSVEKSFGRRPKFRGTPLAQMR